jgi:structural maintenance of chromosome 3 (chondroitin sulfate proteoglycan 6)
MLRDKVGRVTFMPLNRLKPKAIQYPVVEGMEPLIKQLQYDPIFEKAFQQVFGKTCVCEDLTLAAKYARNYDLNTITREGDKVDRKGALTGGYHDVRRSRIDGINAYKHWKAKYNEESERSASLKENMTRLEQNISQLSGSIQVASNNRARLLDSREPLMRELTALQKEKDQLTDRHTKLTEDISNLETELQTLNSQRKSLEDEIGAPMNNNMTAKERDEMQSLIKKVDNLKITVAQSQAEAAQVNSFDSPLDIYLSDGR